MFIPLKDYNPTRCFAAVLRPAAPGLAAAKPGGFFQFLRQGYFCLDNDSSPGQLVFNRSVTLRDSWSKIEKTQQKK
jgi:glutaminyl-tRNA synthetase